MGWVRIPVPLQSVNNDKWVHIPSVGGSVLSRSYHLYNAVRKKRPDIGYATVHRNLKFLAECGIADEIKIANNRARFEQRYGQEHHDHLICLTCGGFTEVHDKKIELLQNKLAEAHDFIPRHHKLEVYGTCRKCR